MVWPWETSIPFIWAWAITRHSVLLWQSKSDLIRETLTLTPLGIVLQESPTGNAWLSSDVISLSLALGSMYKTWSAHSFNARGGETRGRRSGDDTNINYSPTLPFSPSLPRYRKCCPWLRLHHAEEAGINSNQEVHCHWGLECRILSLGYSDKPTSRCSKGYWNHTDVCQMESQVFQNSFNALKHIYCSNVKRNSSQIKIIAISVVNMPTLLLQLCCSSL